MGIRVWSHRGHDRIVLSRTWPDGTRFRRFMFSKAVAKELETRISYAISLGTWRELKEQLARGYQDNQQRSNPTIREFAREYLDYCKVNNRRPDFKEQALSSILPVLGKIRLVDFKRRDADRFKEIRLSKGMAPATVNGGLAVLRHLFSVAVEREYLEHNPLTKYRMLKEVQEPLRILTYEEYRKLIEAVDKHDPTIGAYVAVLGETGMRKSEGLRLEWSHIRKTGAADWVVLIGKAKSGKVRSVPLSELARQWLNTLVRFVDTPYVFVDPLRGKVWKDPYGPFNAGKKAAGLEWIGLHALRHFRATQWLMNGVDVNTVKELLGHSDIHTTMRYVHYVRTHATKAVRLAQEREVAEWGQEKTASGYKVDTASIGGSALPTKAPASAWCERGDSNPHPLRDQILSLARLPIPPLSLSRLIIYRRKADVFPLAGRGLREPGELRVFRLHGVP